MTSPLVIASSDHLGDVDTLVGVADMLEIRLDLGVTAPSAIRAYDGPLPLVVTNRPDGQEESDEAGTKRIDQLLEAIDAEQVWGVDIEYEAIAGDRGDNVAAASAKLLDRAKTLDVTVICSMHPPRTAGAAAMLDQLNAAHEYGDIAKLAVPVETPAELGEIVKATAMASQLERSFATMATGSFGLVSRVLALGLGSRLVYGASVADRPVVEGQPSVDVLREIVDAVQ